MDARAANAWEPPAGWTRITTIDAHAAGEPFRVVTGGIPGIPGPTMIERRRHARTHLDRVRRLLMHEPRGHADMYGCFVTPPATPEAHLGVLFMHNEGFSTMCGHGVIALATVALETGIAAGDEERGERVLRIDTPAGLVTARARVEAGRVRGVRFLNVPSFVLAAGESIEVEGLGRVEYDVAFGGAFYAFVGAGSIGLRCAPGDLVRLVEAGRAIKAAVAASRKIAHPAEEDLGFLYGVIFTDSAEGEGVHSRHVCVFADGEVDRSPTGTGVSARLAILHARGEIRPGERIEIESIAGTRFGGRVVSTAALGPHAAVLPEVDGSAFITGRHEFLLAPDDELPEGLFLR